jgi:hypothetical protein
MTPFSPAAVATQLRDEAAERAAHFAENARSLKTKALEAIGEGGGTAKRAYAAGRKEIDDLAADLPALATDCIKRQPLTSVGVALGGGLLIGAAAGWFAARAR